MNFISTTVYDNDGNITVKKRLGQEIYLFYIPNTDKLNYINVKGLQKTYSYDAKGNVVTDNWKGVTGITYDHRNLPLSMTAAGSGTYYYRYDDGGNRIYKQAGSVKEFYLRDAGGRELAVYDMNTNKIKLANIFGNGGMLGRVDVSWNGSTRTDTRYYYLKDHLGSTRVEFDRYANVSSAYNYYAYGQISSSYNNSNPNDKYKFTGKERDTETNYDYFGARYYDSELGRWMSVDPLASKYPGWSPYNYVLGNPLRLVDSTGREPGFPGGGDPMAYVQSEFNSLWNTGINIINNFKYNALPPILNGVALVTAIPLPGVSLGASLLSTELNVEKNLKDNKGITSENIVSVATTALSLSKSVVISTAGAAIQFLSDQVKANQKNGENTKMSQEQKRKDEQTKKSIKKIDEKLKPISIYRTNNE